MPHHLDPLDAGAVDDRSLARLIVRLVADALDWLAVSRDDPAAPGDAVAAIRRGVDRAIAQRPPAQRDRLPSGRSRAAVLPTVVGVLVDVVWWLDTCDDDVVSPDLAVKVLENVAAGLLALPPAHRDRLLDVLATLAAAEEHAARRHQLTFFPFAMGLVEVAPPG